MKIKEIIITEDAIKAGLARMAEGSFAAADIEKAIAVAQPGNRKEIYMRAADRLLQKERKAGRIKCDMDRKWSLAVAPAPVPPMVPES